MRSWHRHLRWVNLRQAAYLRRWHAAKRKEKIRWTWMSAIPPSLTGASSSNANVAHPRTAKWIVATPASAPNLVSFKTFLPRLLNQWSYIGMIFTISEAVVESHYLTQMFLLLYRSDPEWRGDFLECSPFWPHRPGWPGVFSLYEVRTSPCSCPSVTKLVSEL